MLKIEKTKYVKQLIEFKKFQVGGAKVFVRVLYNSKNSGQMMIIENLDFIMLNN